MRLLTDAEMEQLFGGDDDIQTMPTITVTGTRMTNTGGHYIPGFNAFVREETWGSSCTWCAAYYSALYRVVPPEHVPTRERAKCLANATAQPGKGFRPEIRLNIVNARVFRNPSLSPGATNWIHRNNQSGTVPAGYTQEVNGVTVTSTDGSTGTTNLYAAGMLGGFIPPYTDVTTNQQGTLTGSLTEREMLVFTLGHELYHQHNYGQPQDENAANGWGVYAVQRYRAGAGQACP